MIPHSIQNKFGNVKKAHLIIAATFMLSMMVSAFVYHSAFAAEGQGQVRFDRMQTSQPTSGMVCFTPATTSTDVKTWTVALPTGYTVSTTAADWETSNVSTTNIDGATAWPNAASATATVSGQTVTWTNSSVQTMNSGTQYCYNWTSTSAVTTASSANPDLSGTIATQDHTAAEIDTATYATATVSGDQIAVTATVPPTFSFSLSGSTDTFSSLSTSVVTASATPRVATVSTNAKNGWQVWAKDSNTGLASSSASHTIPTNCSAGAGTNTTLTTSAEGYNTGVAVSTGTLNTVFTGGTSRGGGLCTNYQSLVTGTAPVNNATVTLTNNVSIIGSTPAATDYTDTITVVGAGLF